MKRDLVSKFGSIVTIYYVVFMHPFLPDETTGHSIFHIFAINCVGSLRRGRPLKKISNT